MLKKFYFYRYKCCLYRYFIYICQVKQSQFVFNKFSTKLDKTIQRYEKDDRN